MTIDLNRFSQEHHPEDPEKAICAAFGCGKELNLIEKLCGKYCVRHQERKAIFIPEFNGKWNEQEPVV